MRNENGGASCAWRRVALAAAALLMQTSAHAMAQDVPRHLQIARDFVAHTKPGNNAYSNRNPYTRMPGDFLASDYVVATDCSRFVEDMFRRSRAGVVEQLRTKSLKSSYSIRDWHPSIEREEAFTRVWHAADLKPGDVAVWLYSDLHPHGTPGHMLFIDSEPVKLAKPRKPVVAGLDQYEVAIIDTSQEAKSRDDTRFVSDAALRDENESRGKERGTIASPNHKGVGRGHIRFYANAAGEIQGVAFSFDKAKFHGLDDWSIVVGRPRIKADVETAHR